MGSAVRAADRAAGPTGPEGWAVVGVVVLFLGAVITIPLMSLAGTVIEAPLATWAGVTTSEALHALVLSLVTTAVALAVNLVVGVVGGIVLVRHDLPGKWLLDRLVDVPLAVSPVMTGLGLLLLFGRNGLLFPLLDAIGWKVAFAVPGVVVATLFVTLPFLVREVSLVLVELGTTEEEAAATLGATPWQTFLRVTLPNLSHGLVLGSALTAARALGEFGAVLVVGGAIANATSTSTTFIHGAIESRNEPAAYGMALILAAAAIALLGVLQRYKARLAGLAARGGVTIAEESA